MRVLALVLSAVLLATGLDAAPSPWVEVKSAHFTVITNSGDKAGRRTAWQFEQIRAGLAAALAVGEGRRRPAVLRLRGEGRGDAQDPRARSTGRASGTGPSRSRPAAGTGSSWPCGPTSGSRTTSSANPYQTAYWSYASRGLPPRVPATPPGVVRPRGIAEVMSNTFVREKELHVGRLMQGNLEVMRERAPIPLAEFLSADRRSPWVTQEDRHPALRRPGLGPRPLPDVRRGGAARGRVDRFNRLLHDGVAEDAALKEAFGDMTPYYEGMRSYVTRRVFGYARIPVSLDLRPEGFAARALSVGRGGRAPRRAPRRDGSPGRGAGVRGGGGEGRRRPAGSLGDRGAPFWTPTAGATRRGRRTRRPSRPARRTRTSTTGWPSSSGCRTPTRRSGSASRRDWRPPAQLDPGRALTLSFLAEVLSGQGKHEEALRAGDPGRQGRALRDVSPDGPRTRPVERAPGGRGDPGGAVGPSDG